MGWEFKEETSSCIFTHFTQKLITSLSSKRRIQIFKISSILFLIFSIHSYYGSNWSPLHTVPFLCGYSSKILDYCNVYMWSIFFHVKQFFLQKININSEIWKVSSEASSCTYITMLPISINFLKTFSLFVSSLKKHL